MVRYCLYVDQGRIQGGGAPSAPLKIGNNYDFFGLKIVIFHTKYLKNFRASHGNRKKYDFWREIVIFHTECPKIVRASLRSAPFF
jgi:hypothetical protein